MSSKVNECKSAKRLWDRLKKIYGEEPTTTRLDYGLNKNKDANNCANDKRRSISCCSRDEKKNHMLMAQEIQNEEKTSECESGSHSNNQILFGSDNEDEGDVELDFGGELLCTLEKWKEFKDYKKLAMKEHDLLRKSLE